jgi:hypothetical protein
MESEQLPSTGSGRTEFVLPYDIPFVLSLSKHLLEENPKCGAAGIFFTAQ